MSKLSDKSATSRDVAKMAGVSQSSVCRVFDQNWDGKISSKVRKKVMEAAQELNYCPSAIARSLTANRSGIVGIVVSEEFNQFYYDLLCRMTNQLQKIGMRVMLYNAEPYRDLDYVLEALREYRVDAVFITAAAISREAPPINIKFPVPFILMNIYAIQPFCTSVLTDNFDGSRRMALYMVKQGCKNFIYVTARKSKYFDVDLRRQGFLDGLAEFQMKDCTILDGDYSYESGKLLAKEIFENHGNHPSIFCSGSRMAYGIMDVAREQYQKLAVKDYSIAAYEDTFASGLDAYRLTSVQQDIDAMVEKGVVLMQQALEGQSQSTKPVLIPAKLKIRQSVYGEKC